MNSRIITVAAASALSAFLIVGNPVVASETDNMCAAITAATQQSGSSICVSISDDGVATLTGYVENAMEKAAAEKVAMETEGVKEVVNLITASN